LKEEGGAKEVYAFATHGLFSGSAAENIAKTEALKKVITTDSVLISPEFL
jgi:ribose-phosphate pyrophosphokinase